MEMGNRSGREGAYRYGFNGKELDKEGMGGNGSTYDYGFRIYNPQIAKFLSVDPLFREYPWYTPYQFAGNKPIKFIDLDGLEESEHNTDAGNQLIKPILEVGLRMVNQSEYFKNHAFIPLNKETLGFQPTIDVSIPIMIGMNIPIKVPYNVNKGEEIPQQIIRQVYGSSSVTWCNQFAHNLTRNTLGKSPFGSSSITGMNANKMNNFMNERSDLFYKVDVSQSWDYVNNGAFVFYSWKNPSGASGHIATGVPTDNLQQSTYGGVDYGYGEVVQAGSVVGRLPLMGKGGTYGSTHAAGLQAFVYIESDPYIQSRISSMLHSTPEPLGKQSIGHINSTSAPLEIQAINPTSK